MRIFTRMLVFLAVFASIASAKEMSIAYFDSEKLRANWDTWKEAQAKFDQDVKEWQKQAQTKEEEIQALLEDYQRQQLLLSDDKKQEKERVIQAKQSEYQEFLASVFGENGKAAKRNSELTAPLYDQITRALAKIAERSGYAVIFDSNASGIGYIDPTLEITDDLVKELKVTK